MLTPLLAEVVLYNFMSLKHIQIISALTRIFFTSHNILKDAIIFEQNIVIDEDQI